MDRVELQLPPCAIHLEDRAPGLEYVVNNHGDRFRPLRIGLWDPFQLAFPWLINGGDPNHVFESWDGPSTPLKTNGCPISPSITVCLCIPFQYSITWRFLLTVTLYRLRYPLARQNIPLRRKSKKYPLENAELTNHAFVWMILQP